MSSSLNNQNIDIDTVNEITNSVDTLVDPIGDFFRQRLSLMRSTTIGDQLKNVEEENVGTNQWLIKKSSLEENKDMLNMYEN